MTTKARASHQTTLATLIRVIPCLPPARLGGSANQPPALGPPWGGSRANRYLTKVLVRSCPAAEY